MNDRLGLRSEDDVLDYLGTFFPLRHRSLAVGRGDDCCLVRCAQSLAMSSDFFLEDVHFRRSYFLAEEIGHKALACNVSDLAACGVRPVGFQLCLGLPDDIDRVWLGHFFEGMGSLASAYGMALAGGDISRASSVQVAITVFGEEIGEGAFLSRGGSVPGDAIFVVGQIGLARVGLLELERRGRAAMADYPKACQAHLHPTPQVDAGLLLARIGMNARPPALMDLSDGLARDLPRLLGMTGETGVMAREGGQGIGAELLLPAGSLHPEVVAYCRERHLNPVHEALRGGEDYALLGSCAPDMLIPLHAAIPGLREIGTVTDEGGIICNWEPLENIQGFDHFSSRGSAS